MKKRKLRFLSLLLTALLAFSGCSAANSPNPDAARDPQQIQMNVMGDAQNGAGGVMELEPTADSGNADSEAANSEAVVSGTASHAEISAGLEFDSEVLGEITIPAYSGQAYTAVNNNVPFFDPAAYDSSSFETYGELDPLGRCTGAFACVGIDLMPTEERGSISQVKPSGWQTAEYEIVDGGYLYNRCHLIGYQLTAENANEQNLITGTRYMNVDGMLPFENMAADYIKETENHVLYRVTPLFIGDELVARGVLMEGWSMEDGGDGVCFNVFVYNIQPGIAIDYATGESRLEGSDSGAAEETAAYILNTNTHKFHLPSCASAADIKEENRETFTGSREELIAEGYSPCGNCSP